VELAVATSTGPGDWGLDADAQTVITFELVLNTLYRKK
jgi:hypothetical protein